MRVLSPDFQNEEKFMVLADIFNREPLLSSPSFGVSSGSAPSPEGSLGTLGNDSPGALTSDTTPIQSAQTAPAFVPAIVSNVPAVNPGQITGSSGVPVVTPVTSPSISSGIVAYLGDVFANPSQHILGIIVLSLIAFWAYKHIRKALK